MARFRKRCDSWTVEIRRKGFKPIARTFDTKAQGEKRAAEVESKMLAGRYVVTREAESLTLGGKHTWLLNEKSQMSKKRSRFDLNNFWQHESLVNLCV